MIDKLKSTILQEVSNCNETMTRIEKENTNMGKHIGELIGVLAVQSASIKLWKMRLSETFESDAEAKKVCDECNISPD